MYAEGSTFGSTPLFPISIFDLPSCSPRREHAAKHRGPYGRRHLWTSENPSCTQFREQDASGNR